MTEKLTPMMQQYFEVKRGLPANTLLLFRLGDFYEMFFEDAEMGARLLGITLTRRQETPMCGIPHHAAENYVAKLLAAGKKVAICDQAEPAKAGKLVKRTMDHSYVQTLVERGELTEEEANVHPQSNILMGCLGAEDDPPTDLAFIQQLRPGDVLMACSDGVWHYFNSSELGSVLSSLSPREATEFLIEKARSRGHGGGDNLSLVIVKVEPLDS